MQHRTALITAGSIVGVVIAGVSAVAAGMGILDRSADSPVGQLSAEAPASQVVDVYVTDPAPTGTLTTVAPAGPAVQSFAVEQAGMVSLSADGDRLSLVDVAPTAGWTWESHQSDTSSLVVTLSNGTDTYELAAAASQGTITANATLLAPPSAAAPAPVGGDDDDHGDDDGGEHEDREEHEGADDDD